MSYGGSRRRGPRGAPRATVLLLVVVVVVRSIIIISSSSSSIVIVIIIIIMIISSIMIGIVSYRRWLRILISMFKFWVV